MTVFANMLEVSCKAQANKVIAAFPDVCMTPPENPATPPGVPVPYPNFGMDSDTDKGTGNVKIGGKTVNQKNTSYFTKTSGDEAGAAAKKGVVSSKNTGKAYSQAFSMNVKAEGKNVTRFSDIQTDNHGSPPNVIPVPKVGKPDAPATGNATDADCLVGKHEDIKDKCNKRKDANGKANESHHVVPDFVYRLSTRKAKPQVRMDSSVYPTEATGMAICLPRDQHRGGKSRVPESVHGNLDPAIQALGAATAPGSPSGTAQIKKIRGECFAKLAKLVPKYISKNCYKKVVQEVMKQTQPFADNMGKTEKSPSKVTAAARQVLT